MSSLDGIVKDVVAKRLTVAKQKIFDTLQAKAMDRVQAMKPDVASKILTVEEEVEKEEESSEEEDEESSEEEVEEGLKPVRKRINPQDRRDAAKYYRKNKTKIKHQQKKYRKSALGKRTAAKQERLSKVGKTSTGKRISTITNKRI